jgi:hypothetical protein
VVGALDDDHVEPDAADDEPPDGVAPVERPRVRPGLGGDVLPDPGEVAVRDLRLVRSRAPVVRVREVFLLEMGVDR